MTTKSRATAAKTTEPKPKGKADVPVYAFPLPASHYFSVPVTARKSSSSGPYVAAIQRALGLKQTGTFDEELRTTVMGWQDKGKRPVTGTIDKDDWDALFNDL